MRIRSRWFFSAALAAALIVSLAGAQAQTKSKPSSASSKSASSKKKRVAAQRAAMAARLRRMNRAFVASADLRPMAIQLLQNRTPAAYAGVEAYARKHAADDAGALANLVLGYAHTLDKDYAKAIDPLKKAQPRADELADYADYLLGSAYQNQGQGGKAVTNLKQFSTKYPESLFVRDAAVVYADALIDEEDYKTAIQTLLPLRLPVRADVEFTLGKAYIESGDIPKGAAILKNVYFTMPLSGEADQAKAVLESPKAGAAAVAKVRNAPFADRKSRAGLLVQGKRYAEAASEYHQILDDNIADDPGAIQVALGAALWKSGNNREARKVLESATATGEAHAQRLYVLAEIARSDGDEDKVQMRLGQLRDIAPTSPWLEETLLMAGNMNLVKKNYDLAIDYYRELADRFPSGAHSSYAHWKATWLNYRQGRKEEARKGIEDQIARYPGAAETPAALYWRARLAEDDRQYGKARACYVKLEQRFPHYYYAGQAQLRLAKLASGDDPAPDPLLEKIPPLSSLPRTLSSTAAPPEDLHLSKSRLLSNGGFLDLAVKELQAAGSEGWVTREIAQVYRDANRYDRAIELYKHTAPNYTSFSIPVLPHGDWEALFPRPWWSDLKAQAEANQLDPYLVASLIRQESEFNPGAVSRAAAVGLMQLLPATGKKVAREMHLKHFSTDQLLQPTVNLQLGTRYFKTMVDHFNGQPEYALAAYNAGADRVETWLAEGKFRDVPEFVESIPFTETRDYVQAILRNQHMYKQIYGSE